MKRVLLDDLDVDFSEGAMKFGLTYEGQLLAASDCSRAALKHHTRTEFHSQLTWLRGPLMRALFLVGVLVIAAPANAQQTQCFSTNAQVVCNTTPSTQQQLDQAGRAAEAERLRAEAAMMESRRRAEARRDRQTYDPAPVVARGRASAQTRRTVADLLGAGDCKTAARIAIIEDDPGLTDLVLAYCK